ncbi:hypothetical protein GCM10027599_21780 [Yimella radicis]
MAALNRKGMFASRHGRCTDPPRGHRGPPNQFNYVGGLLGAVMTGAVGNDNLRLGFAVPMMLVLAILPLAKAFRT